MRGSNIAPSFQYGDSIDTNSTVRPLSYTSIRDAVTFIRVQSASSCYHSCHNFILNCSLHWKARGSRTEGPGLHQVSEDERRNQTSSWFIVLNSLSTRTWSMYLFWGSISYGRPKLSPIHLPYDDLIQLAPGRQDLQFLRHIIHHSATSSFVTSLYPRIRSRFIRLDSPSRPPYLTCSVHLQRCCRWNYRTPGDSEGMCHLLNNWSRFL